MDGLHVHISWATAVITVLTFVAVIGSLNLLARSAPGSSLGAAWSLIASPN